MCITARPSVGPTDASPLDRRLSPDLRLATSTPGNDPGGDHALAVIKRAEAVHPGADRALTGEMLTLVGGPSTMAPTAGRSPSAAILLGGHADAVLYHCSSADRLLREVPDLVDLPLPEAVEVHPTYGAAVLSEDAAVERFGFGPLAAAR